MQDSFDEHPACELLKEMRAKLDELQHVYSGPLAHLHDRFLHLQEEYSDIRIVSRKDEGERRRMRELLAQMRSITAEYQAIVRHLRSQFYEWKTVQSFARSNAPPL